MNQPTKKQTSSHILISLIHLVFITLVGCAQGGSGISDDNIINPSTAGAVSGGDSGGDSRSGGAQGGPIISGGQEGRPSLMRIGDRVAVVGELLTIQLQASDPENDLLSFSLRSALPEGAKFEKETGIFTWTPLPDQSGRSFLLTFEVSDSMLKDQETVAVRVSAAGSQEVFPPSIDLIGDQLLTVGQTWTYQLIGEDPNGQALSYRVDGMIPVGLELNANTGLIQWTPMAADVGRYDLVAAVSDGEAEVTTPLRLIVRDADDQSSTNTPPMFNPISPQQVVAGAPLSFEISATDDTPMNLVYAAEMIPEFSEFNPNTRRFSWTPSANLGGTSHDAIFLVSDGEFRGFLRVSIEVTQPIRNCPADPAGMSGGESPINEGALLSGRVICNQDEIDTYTITLDREAIIDLSVSFNFIEGDLDVYLFNSAGDQIGSAAGVTSEERVTTSNLSPGVYRVEVILYGSGGPVTYDIGYTTLDPMSACTPDSYEGQGGNNNEETAVPLPVDQIISLNLCQGDVDYFVLDVERGSEIDIDLTFRHDIADVDLRLVGPPVGDGLRDSAWSATSTTDNELLILDSAPVTGRYILEVRAFNAVREVSYDISVFVTPAAACNADRLEPNNNTEASAAPLTPELYQELTACVDEDWYSTAVTAGRSLILYLTYDSGTPVVSTRGGAGALPSTSITFSGPVDGCLTERAFCSRYQIDPSPNGETVRYAVSFREIGIEYDLRVRIGDEAGATCVDNLDCNEGFLCYSNFDAFLFNDGLCAKECEVDSDCGGQRACMADAFGNQICLQRCDQGLSCRDQFSCQPEIITTNGVASLCLSDDYSEE